jgi:hypothetical protein
MFTATGRTDPGQCSYTGLLSVGSEHVVFPPAGGGEYPDAVVTGLGPLRLRKKINFYRDYLGLYWISGLFDIRYPAGYPVSLAGYHH